MIVRRSMRFGYGFVAGLIFMAALFVMASAVDAQAVSLSEAMAAANQQYEAGEYAQAAEIYESIVASGVESSYVYYNLGNAYFKQGDLGHAILNYRRADRLAPRDDDISSNLEIARAQTLDQLEVADDGTLINFVKLAEEWLTLDEASILALVSWLLICFFAIVAIVSNRLRRASLWMMGVLGLFLILGLFSVANRIYSEHAYPSAVIVAREVDVTSGPGSASQYLVEFNLHAGAEVREIERRSGWRRITLPGNDFQGWVPADAVERVMAE